MDVIVTIFWILLILVFYTYIGYALLLIVFTLFTKKPAYDTGDLPALTVVIPAYNEEEVIEQKLLNTIGLDYPHDKLKVVVIVDGGTDATEAKARTFPFAYVLTHEQRKGKAASLNYAMEHVNTPLVLFSDANTMLNQSSLKNIVRHFRDEKTGAVAGEKKVAHASGVGTAEGWYWKYESFMKKLDGDFNTIIGATGELFCLRSILYKPLDEDMILDDLMLSMNICLTGYRIAYEPGAYAVEMPSSSLDEEKKRKVRIASGAFQALSMLSFKKMMSHPTLLFQFFSRRWLRWVLCPFSIPLIFLLNIFLAIRHPDNVYDLLLAGQILFYLAALIGYLNIRRAFVLTTIPFYFLFMNYCMILGLLRYRRGGHSSLWTKSERSDGESNWLNP